MTEDVTYPKGITPELLMAYADGALPPDDVARVDAAISAFPELAEEVAAFKTTSLALKGAFDGPMDEPVPDHLAALVMGPLADTDGDTVVSLQDARTKRSLYSSPFGQAIAACAVFAFGLVAGAAFLGEESSIPGENGDLLLAGRLDAGHPISQALEATASAELVSFRGGQFDAVASFMTNGNVPCREFEAADETGAVVGVACRRDDSWSVELLLAASPTGTPQSDFQLASAFDAGALDGVLNALGASQGLSASQEACLIQQGWDPEKCET